MDNWLRHGRGLEKYEDVDDAGSRLLVALDTPGDDHHTRGPGAPSHKEFHTNYFVQGSVDSGRDGDPATDGAASERPCETSQ